MPPNIRAFRRARDGTRSGSRFSLICAAFCNSLLLWSDHEFETRRLPRSKGHRTPPMAYLLFPRVPGILTDSIAP